MQEQGTQTIEIRGEQLLLHPLRAVYWVSRRTLLLADLHLGKADHFRRAGIAVPQAVSDTNFARLQQLLTGLRPRRVLLLGDLFHSTWNHVWEDFVAFVAGHPDTSFELVPGNHDILGEHRYAAAGLHLHAELLPEGPFLFSHHPLLPENMPEGYYNFAGHVHPCARLQGHGRQQMRLPCFYFGQTGAILPAFGAFTGCGPLPVRKGDQVFVLAESTVLRVS